MDHYYSKNQESKSKPFKIRAKILNDEFEIWSDQGIFSKDELDEASALLIEKFLLKNNLDSNSSVLDLGCGNGVVGISILRRFKECKVTFSDVSERAVQITKKNLELLSLKGEVSESDGFEKINKKFDYILLNPPYAAGREVCYKLIEQSFDHLTENGTLWLVARHKKGGEMLGKKIFEVFGNMSDDYKRAGFRIYVGKKE